MALQDKYHLNVTFTLTAFNNRKTYYFPTTALEKAFGPVWNTKCITDLTNIQINLDKVLFLVQIKDENCLTDSGVLRNEFFTGPWQLKGQMKVTKMQSLQEHLSVSVAEIVECILWNSWGRKCWCRATRGLQKNLPEESLQIMRQG